MKKLGHVRGLQDVMRYSQTSRVVSLAFPVAESKQLCAQSRVALLLPGLAVKCKDQRFWISNANVDNQD